MHKNELLLSDRRLLRDDNLLVKRHLETFIEWLKHKVINAFLIWPATFDITADIYIFKKFTYLIIQIPLDGDTNIELNTL